ASPLASARPSRAGGRGTPYLRRWAFFSILRQPLARHGILDSVLERFGRAPLARWTRGAIRPDLVDVPVDLEVIAVGVLELDRDLAARPPPALEHHGHAALAQPRSRAEHLVQRPHLEREVVEAARGDPGLATDQRDAVVVGIEPEED